MQHGQIQQRKPPPAAPSSSGRPDAEVQRSPSDDTSEASTSGKDSSSEGNGAIALDTNPAIQVAPLDTVAKLIDAERENSARLMSMWHAFKMFP